MFVEVMPPAPDAAVALWLYDGEALDTRNAYDTPRLQVRVRGGPDPRVSRRRCWAIYSALHETRRRPRRRDMACARRSARHPGPHGPRFLQPTRTRRELRPRCLGPDRPPHRIERVRQPRSSDPADHDQHPTTPSSVIKPRKRSFQPIFDECMPSRARA
nr:minor capsid protein [Streptomyces sp. HUCO-GS316]